MSVKSKTYRQQVSDKPFFQLKAYQLSSLTLMLFFIWQFQLSAIAKTDKPLKDITFLGLNLIDTQAEKVREHFLDIGGFLQAKTTVKQHNIDKFFPWSAIRDSYYVVFQYNHAGKIVSVKRLYRPYSDEYNSRQNSVDTTDIARKMIPALGQPTQIKRKGWGGSLLYSSYHWEDDTMQITIDREGGERLGNVFIKYQVKTHDRWAIDVNKKDGGRA